MNGSSWITQVGAFELAAGALLGWAVMASSASPGSLAKFGVKQPMRIRQCHLDLVIMGVILIAAGLAAPDFPMPWSALLVGGAIANALLFLPMAFMAENPSLKQWAAAAISFAAMSTGTVALAIYLL